MRIRIFGLVALLLLAPSLAWGQVVIPGTGGAVVTPPAGARTSVIPGACSGTDKVTGITTTGAVQCNTDVTGTTSPLTTKGDLWGFSTVDGRIAVGSNDQCLVADSTAAFGIKWGSCAAGGSGITSLGAQTGSTQTFSKVNDTNVTLAIASASDDHKFTLGWTGTLADSRLAQITTAGKVSGAAITLFSSVPSGAGNLPLVNIPDGTANQILGTDAAGTAAEHKSLATGTAGTDFAILHGAGLVTFNLPVASTTNTGKLSNTDWDTFTAKEDDTHASEHQNAGGDEVATATAAANAIPKANASADLDPAWLITGTVTISRCLRTDGSGNVVVAAADCGAGGGEANTHSSDGGGLALTAATPKVGVDLRLVSLAAADFDLAADLFTIDDTKWAKDSELHTIFSPNADPGVDHSGLSGGTGITEVAGVFSCDAASATAVGCPELATIAETDTGTDAARVVTPDGLAGSVFGQVEVQMVLFDFTTAVATGDGKFYFHIAAGSKLIGMDLIDAVASVITVSSSGLPTIDIARCAPVATGNPCLGTVADVLTVNLTIDANEDSSDTATTDITIATASDDVLVDQTWRIDVDVAGTGTKGLIVTLIFQLP